MFRIHAGAIQFHTYITINQFHEGLSGGLFVIKSTLSIIID